MYLEELLGGVLIGLGSALPLLFFGRIAGISGYAASAMRPKSNDGKTGLLLVLGLALGAFVFKIKSGHSPATPDEGMWVWAIAGLLVGFGSRLGGGCTSGHGVCGLGRFSPRSPVSVFLFMATAILVVEIRSRL